MESSEMASKEKMLERKQHHENELEQIKTIEDLKQKEVCKMLEKLILYQSYYRLIYKFYNRLIFVTILSFRRSNLLPKSLIKVRSKSSVLMIHLTGQTSSIKKHVKKQLLQKPKLRKKMRSRKKRLRKIPQYQLLSLKQLIVWVEAENFIFE